MGIFSKLIAKISGTSNTDPLDWLELENELIAADIGSNLTSKIIVAAKEIKGGNAQESLIAILNSQLSSKNREIVEINPTSAILIVGVNGTGKTTSAAKLAAYLKNREKRVILAAADTFRAAAVEQLQTWGGRIGVEVITGKSNSDPAAVAFDAANQALALSSQFLLIDTAGRLHNKSDLMAELSKVRRVIEKSMPIAEVLLVIDGSSGQNAINQARLFMESVQITGLILTKLDGSARGGVALAIESALDLPIKFVGTGEKIEDFSEFDPERYLLGLIQS